LVIFAAEAPLLAATNWFILNQDTEGQLLAPHFHLLDNHAHKHPTAEIVTGRHDDEFASPDPERYFLAFSDDPSEEYWVRLAVNNQFDEIPQYLYSSHNSTPGLHGVYYRSIDGELIDLAKRGSGFAHLQRTRKFFSLPPGPGHLYLQLKPDPLTPLILEFSILRGDRLLGRNPDLTILAISYGIAISLLAYNLILVISLRTYSQIMYLIYCTLTLAYLEGRYQFLAQQFGIPPIPIALHIPINSLAALSFPWFIAAFIEIRRYPRLKWSLWALSGLTLVIIGLSFVDTVLAQRLLISLLIFFSPIAIIMCLVPIMKGNRLAYYLLISSLFPTLGTMIHFGGLPFVELGWNHPLREYAQIVGIDIEMILCSMALGIKLRHEKDVIIKRMNHGYSELKTIVLPHQIDQIWRGRSLPQTMPCGPGEACVLSFDIVKSSSIHHPRRREFFSRIFARCYTEMMQNYVAEPLTANAYRIKEMGDGFLCSVGYPFQTPYQLSKEVQALQLAVKFIDIFQQEVALLDYPRPIHCAIGLATGLIEGFYPETGAKVYDLYGRAIILANRYEAVRNLIFKNTGHAGDIIITREDTFRRLPAAEQTGFYRLELNQNTFRVRDDETANCLYYRYVTPIGNQETGHTSSRQAS
jgi:hypothetical protein